MSVATTNTTPVTTMKRAYRSGGYADDLTQEAIESSRKDGSWAWISPPPGPQSKK
jgi:hypothetical protein